MEWPVAGKTLQFRALRNFNIGNQLSYQTGDVFSVADSEKTLLRQLDRAAGMGWVEALPARRRCYEPPPVDNSPLDLELEALLHRIEDEGLQDALRRTIRRRINR